MLRRLVAILVVLTALGPTAVLAADPPSVDVVTGDPASLAFGHDRTATVVILIANRTDSAFDTAASIWDPEAGIVTTSDEPDAGAFFVTSVDPLSIAAGDTIPISIEVEARAGVELTADRAAGLVLLVGSEDTVPITLSIPPTARALANAKAEPASATFTVLCPHPLSCQDDDGMTVDGPADSNVFGLLGGEANGEMPKPREVTLTSEDGGRMEVKISRFDKGAWNFSVNVLSASSTGTYTGSVELDPEIDDGPAVDLTVNATHHWLWPFLTVIVGVIVAGLWAWLGEGWRPKKILLLHLRAAGAKYAAGRTQCPAPADSGDWMSGSFRLTNGKLGDLVANGTFLGDKAFDEIQRASGADGIQDAETRVRDISELVRVWLRACGVVSELQELVTRYGGDPVEEAAVFGVAEALLEVKEPLQWTELGEASLAEQAANFINERRDQAAAIELYAEAKKWYRKAWEGWDNLTRAEQAQVLTIDPTDPKSDWDTSIEQLATREQWEAADLELRMARRVAHYNAVIRQRPPETGVASLSHKITVYGLGLDIARSRADIALRHPKIEARSPSAILKEIQFFDLLYFLWVASIAILIYFVALYPDSTFGHWSQYLAAFLAAASGALIIDWALLPWFRSYRLPDAD